MENKQLKPLLDFMEKWNKDTTVHTRISSWEMSKSGKTLILTLANGNIVRHRIADIIPTLATAPDADLTTRTRRNVILDRDLYAKLQAHSTETGIPISRLLDRAIRETYHF